MLNDAYNAIESQDLAFQPIVHYVALPVQLMPVFEIQPLQNAQL